ncbi:Uncharacterized protein dnm_040250 [Desulfonema magnum]|uniref:Uncharacterized protein n=1 Tax=Desulfonema magnum TaxID=45655 RepID=A0A975BN63_9BACT|nr:Uncharacterized protein dnm_040250 [Desulfonema magnum]
MSSITLAVSRSASIRRSRCACSGRIPVFFPVSNNGSLVIRFKNKLFINQ